MSAVETAKIAELTRSTGDYRAAKKALNDGKASKSAIARAAARGAVAGKNPDLIDKVADGDLSEEHLDVIAETDAKTGGAASTNAGFINDVAGVNPDQAKGVRDKFIADHADPDGLQSEHDRQRLLCGPCHRRLHANNHTLFRHTNRTWRTRPATPNETLRQRVNYPQRE